LQAAPPPTALSRLQQPPRPHSELPTDPLLDLLPSQVGWAFAFFAVPLALYCLLNPSAALEVDPLYGISTRETRLSALAVGYFAWVCHLSFFSRRKKKKQVLMNGNEQDAFVTSLHIKTQGLGFFLHGFGCFNAFLFTLRPFLMWCGPNFLIVRLVPLSSMTITY
jgi:hypothetical protein